MPNLHQNAVISNGKNNNVGAVLHRPTIAQVRLLLPFLPPRPDYQTWLQVISAVGNSFDEQTALTLLLEHFSDEKPDEHLHKLRHRLPNTGFATLVWLAKERGFKPDAAFYADSPRPSGTMRQSVRKPEINFDDVRGQQDVVVDNMTGERLFRLSVNPYVIDKTNDYATLNAKFQNVELTSKHIAAAVRRGWALCNAKLTGTRRCNEHFGGSELVILDIDSGLTLEEAFSHKFSHNALLIYTTPSHSAANHRFRLIFPLAYVERNAERYREVVRAFQGEYSADPAPSAPVQTFFGSSQGSIWLVEEGGSYVQY